MAQQTTNAHLTSAEEKATAKAALQKELGWQLEPRRAVICVPTGLSEAAGGAIFEELVGGLPVLQAQIVILGKGSEHFGRLCTKLAKERGHQVAIVPSDNASVAAMLKASDIALFLTAPNRSMVETMIGHGIVPVCPQCEDVQNYNPNQESGIGFTYDGETGWHCFAALTRCLETFRFPFDWKTIQRNGLESLS